MVRAAQNSAHRLDDFPLKGRVMKILGNSNITLPVNTCINMGVDWERLRAVGDGFANNGIAVPGSGDR